MTANEIELKSLKESLQDTQPVGAIVTCCRTLDQVKILFDSCRLLVAKFFAFPWTLNFMLVSPCFHISN